MTPLHRRADGQDRAARDGPEGVPSGRSRVPCAPATFPMCLAVTCAAKLWAAPRVVNGNCYSHHAWLLRRRQGLFFVIRWFSCGVAPVFRPRHPTVSAPRPPPASFDATHGHVSLFYFHFSRRERAATQLVPLARNGPLSTHDEKNKRALPLQAASRVVPRPRARGRRNFGLRPTE